MIKLTLLAREIDKLKERILLLGGKVEERVKMAVSSVHDRDRALAEKVIEGDREIDVMEVDLEEECLKILALHQPVAVDLRFIVTVLKVNNDLERIGDLAVNIAEVSVLLAGYPTIKFPFDFEQMASKAEQMLTNSLNALVDQNVELAEKVRHSDDEVDDIHQGMYTAVAKAMKQNPDRIDCLIKTMSISRALERIADLSTNIAEDVIYLAEGAIVRH
jgi:phosphate transport system protein